MRHWLPILLLLLSSRHAAAQGVVADTLPSVVVTRMYEAYNRHEAAAAMQYFADSFPGSVLTRDSMIVVLTPAILGARLDSLFHREPGRHIGDIELLVNGPFVATTGRKSGTATDGVDLWIFEVRGGRIRRMWATP
jgi:hypothetical protein